MIRKLLSIMCFIFMFATSALADVAINDSNFPDTIFRNYVKDFDNDGDDVLSDLELSEVTEINITNKRITSLTGIEYFTSLITLDCSTNSLTELDVSSNTAITELACRSNKIAKLDLSSNTALTELDCRNNRLTELDVSNNAALTSINCLNNLLAELDVGSCSSLVTLNCSNNSLAKLDVSYNDALTVLNCSSNRLTRLYVSDNTSLTSLNCYDNQLTTLYVSENNTLVSLYCGKNNISNLYLRNNTALAILDCVDNQLEKLYLSDNNALSELYCNDNKLVDLYVGDNVSLSYLDCSNNQLPDIDLSKNTALTSLKCNDNLLMALDLRANTALTVLECENNSLSELDLSNNTSLQNLSCDGQQVETVLTVRTFDFNSIFTPEKLSLISAESVQGLNKAGGSITTLYSSDTGIAEFSQVPAFIRYNYSTSLEDKVLPVSLAVVAATKARITTTETDIVETKTNYRFRFNATGFRPITWTLMKGKMLKTLELSPSGLMYGTVTKEGRSKLTISAANEYGSDTKIFNVNSAIPPAITTASLKKATIGKNYSDKLKATGSKKLLWHVDGKLPSGITFDEAKGSFKGNTQEKGIYRLRVTLSNPAGYTEKSIILETHGILPKITGNLKNGTDGKEYKATLKATGTTPITMTYSGDLPSGLSFDETTWTFYGTPTEVCTREIIVTATNIEGSTTAKYTLTINGVAPKVVTTSLHEGAVGESYSADLQVTGTTPITYSATGLPPGLSINANTGYISGTPTTPGKFKVTLLATNIVKATKKNFNIEIKQPPVFNDSGTLPDATAGLAYSYTFNVTGTAKITIEQSGGKIPNGLSIKGSKIMGKPQEGGIFNFTVKASNAISTDTKEFSLTVKAVAPKITGASLPIGTVGKKYNVKLTVTGTAPISWTVDKTLPAGLTFSGTDKDFVLSGTPTEAFDQYINITASNVIEGTGLGDTVSKYIRLVVNEPSGNKSKSKNLPAVKEVNSTPKDKVIEFAIPANIPAGENMDTNPNAPVHSNYVVVCELPEITVDEAGMYDLDIVLPEDVDIGAELVWLAGSDEPSEDDEIAEFYSDDGEEITTVPESRNITASAWLNVGTMYKPKIAVKIGN